MRPITLRALVATACLAVVVPLVLLVARITYAAGRVPRDVLVLDTIVLGAGMAAMMAFVAAHAYGAVAKPLSNVERQLQGLAGGRLDRRLVEEGTADVQRLARATNALAAEMERRVQAAAMQSGSQAMGAVLLGVAHEVNNPLAHLRLRLDLLSQREGMDPAAMDSLRRGLDRLDDLVQTLRTSAGSRGAHPPGRLIRGAVIVAQRAVLEAQVEHEVVTERLVECVPRQVVHALSALLNNAGEAGAKQIRVSARDDGAWMLFEVADDGHGIAPEILGQERAAFVTTKAGHAGLGLALATAEVEAQGGSLHITPRGDGGTIARLRLPAARE